MCSLLTLLTLEHNIGWFCPCDCGRMVFIVLLLLPRISGEEYITLVKLHVSALGLNSFEERKSKTKSLVDSCQWRARNLLRSAVCYSLSLTLWAWNLWALTFTAEKLSFHFSTVGKKFRLCLWGNIKWDRGGSITAVSNVGWQQLLERHTVHRNQRAHACCNYSNLLDTPSPITAGVTAQKV